MKWVTLLLLLNPLLCCIFKCPSMLFDSHLLCLCVQCNLLHQCCVCCLPMLAIATYHISNLLAILCFYQLIDYSKYQKPISQCCFNQIYNSHKLALVYNCNYNISNVYYNKYITLMKGSASVNPVFQPINIIHPTIFSIQPLIAIDPHRLYFGTYNNSIRWDHKSIINCTFSDKHGALIILSEEGRLHIFTESLDEIARIPWQSKYSVGLEFIDERNMFLMIGATAVEVQYVRIFSNIKSTKFVSSMSFNIEKKEKFIADPETKLQWNKGYNYNVKENLLYLWSSKDLNFYNLDNLQLKSRILSLTRKDLSITYVLYNSHYKYTVTGLINGHIKVWRLPQNSLTSKDYILIHKYTRHSKQVDKIVEGSDYRIIISCSEEMIVCLWSLQTFELLRQYDFLGAYTRIILFNGNYSLAIKDSELGKLKFGKTLQFIADITSEVIYIDKYRQQAKLDKSSPVGSVQITLGSNLGFQIREQQLNTKDLNKIQIQYIYPPLKAKGIQQIVASPYILNQYYLLVENGQIFRLRIENGSGKIEQSYSIQRTKDVQFHQLNQSPSYIKFLNIVPPQFDSEINQNTIQKKQKKQWNQQQLYLDLKLIAIGCNKGTVVFLKTTNIESIYTRVSYHRQTILGLQCFRANGLSYLISYCSQLYLKIVRFDQDKANCILSLFTAQSISFFRGIQDRFVLVLKRGFFEIFQLDQQQRDYCFKNNKNSDHQQQILAIDADPQRKLLLTAAADNKIKIWSYCKILLYQIILDDGLKNAVWFRPFQMLISHNLKILYFKNIGLKISQTEIQEMNQQFIETADQKFNIQDTLKSIKTLKDDTKFEMRQSFKDFSKLPQIKYKQTKKVGISSELIQLSSTQNNSPVIQSTKKATSQNKKKRKLYNTVIEQEMPKQKIVAQTDLQAVRKHLDDIKELRKQTNESVLPKIKPKSQDAFDNFMRSKLINKKVLTRRDITLNRIIMKNIIKEHFGADNDITSNLKLDF